MQIYLRKICENLLTFIWSVPAELRKQSSQVPLILRESDAEPRNRAVNLLTNLSIRSVLGLIIGFLGILLVGLSANGGVGAIERNNTAKRVERLAGTSKQLFAILLGFRLERGAAISALMADVPI